MALIFCDSFDHYVTADIGEKWGTVGAGSIVAATGRRSSASMHVGVIGAVITKTYAPASLTAIIGAAVNVSALIATQGIFEIRSGATVQASVGCNASGLLTLYRSHPLSGTLLATAALGAITTGTYYYIEAKIVIGTGTSGSGIVHVNGVEVINQGSLNTAQSGVAVWDSAALDSNNGNNDYDDFYLLDSSGVAPFNDFLGDVRVDTRYTTAEGNSSSWTPSSGSDNALMIDETAPDDDTTYNSTGTVNHVDTHVVQDAPVAGALFYGVQLNLSMKKSDAGICTVAPVVRHSSTDNVGSDIAVTTSYLYSSIPYSLNPGTTAAWTEAEFNAAEFGYKRTS